MTNKTILHVDNMGITFGGLKAVQGVNMTLQQGELVGLIGPNGAGKTTSFNMLTGVYKPTHHRPLPDYPLGSGRFLRS